VVVLRLVVEGPGDYASGEVLDASGRVVARFHGWTGLAPALHGWLVRENADEGPEEGEPGRR
jgi:hypothetical protein